MDRETGEFHVYALKQVVKEMEEEDLEISLEEAQQLNPDAAEGDTLWARLLCLHLDGLEDGLDTSPAAVIATAAARTA